MRLDTLTQTLHSVLQNINSSLADNVKVAMKKEVIKVNKQRGLDKLTNRLESLRVKKEEIAKEIDNLQKDIREKEGINRDELMEDELTIIQTYCNRYEATKSIVEASRNLIGSTDAVNYLNFLKVKSNTETMFNLAINQKEKRNIILSLQARDWRSLGIDLPQLPFFEKFTIEDGIINVPSLKMISSK